VRAAGGLPPAGVRPAGGLREGCRLLPAAEIGPRGDESCGRPPATPEGAGRQGGGVRAGRQGGASERGISRSNRESRKPRCFAPNLSMGALCFTIDDVLCVLCRSVGRFAHLASPDSQGRMVRWLNSHSENLAGQGSRSWLAIREVRDGGGASRFLKGEMPKWQPCMSAATHCLVCFVMPADRGFCHNGMTQIYSSCQHPSMVKHCCDALCNAIILSF
jgi:hypothetical protein